MAKKLIERQAIDVAPGEDTYRLGIIRENWSVDGKTETHWLYDYPDGVVVLAITPEKKIIAIRKWRPGIGEYPQIPAETLEPGELETLRTALAQKDEAMIATITTQAALRCLAEETGYTAGTIELLTILSQHSGKTPMVHAFCLAMMCTKIADEGSGQKEEGITLLPLTEAAVLFEMLMAYLTDKPSEPHGGKNSLVAMTLALYRLGMLKVVAPIDY